MNDFAILEEGVVTSSYQTSFHLVPGANYRFKVQARNSVGFSLLSTDVTIRAARRPDAPENVITTNILNTNISISWSAPYDGGSPITSYVIQIQRSDNVSYAENSYCLGTNLEILTTTQCTVTIDSIKAAPFTLPWGSHVNVQVSAVNLVGSSPYSALGNGAIIITNPFAPQNLTEDV